MSNYPPQYAYPSAPPMVRAIPNPPRLHWGWVLFFQIVTVGMFGMAWYLVQAVWVKRVTGRKVAFWWALAYLLFLPLSFFAGMIVAIVAIMQHVPTDSLVGPVQALARIVAFVLAVGTAFSMKSELEREPIGMSLGGGMTFFFGPIYFQYHLRDWTPEGGAGAPDAPQGLGLSGGPVKAVWTDVPSEPGVGLAP